MSGKSRFDRIVSSDAGPNADPEAARMRELAALVEMRLGQPLDKETFWTLSRIQNDLQSRQQALSTQLEDGRITPEQYLFGFQGELRTAMARSRTLLGEDRFLALFGEAGYQPEGLVDKDRFLAAHAQAR